MSRTLIPVMMIALVLTACGDSGSEPTATTTAATQATTATSAATTVPAATSTVAPGTTVTATTMAPTTTESMGGEATIIEVIGLEEQFSIREMNLGVGELVTVIFNNKDSSGEPHNFHVRTDTDDWFTQIAVAPDIQELTFSIDHEGEFTFFCDTHTDTMVGTIFVSDM